MAQIFMVKEYEVFDEELESLEEEHSGSLYDLLDDTNKLDYPVSTNVYREGDVKITLLEKKQE